MTDLVFVYGTLLSGEANHHLLKGATFCGTHTTIPKFRMLHLGSYPGVVSNGSHAIHGEIYEIDKRILKQLDRLEDYPILYDRKRIQTPWGRTWIYLYLGERDGYAVIPSGSWRGQSRQVGKFSLY